MVFAQFRGDPGLAVPVIRNTKRNRPQARMPGRRARSVVDALTHEQIDASMTWSGTG